MELYGETCVNKYTTHDHSPIVWRCRLNPPLLLLIISGVYQGIYQEVLFKLQEANSQGLLLRHPVIMEGWVGNARLFLNWLNIINSPIQFFHLYRILISLINRLSLSYNYIIIIDSYKSFQKQCLYHTHPSCILTVCSQLYTQPYEYKWCQVQTLELSVNTTSFSNH